MTRKTLKNEADFSGFKFKIGQMVATLEGVIIGTVIARLFIEGAGGGISRAYMVRNHEPGGTNRFEFELRCPDLPQSRRVKRYV